jgi:beta-glucosidase
LSSTRLKAGDSLTVEADVKNASQRDGDEVVELYLSFPKSAAAPLRALRGFTRVHLGEGETQHINFTLNSRDLSEVDENGDRILAKGIHSISVGGGQPGTGAPQVAAEFKIKGSQKLPE